MLLGRRLYPFSLRVSVGAACATVLNQQEPKLASTMVSHHWENLFAHLVAAIVADALEQATYASIVHRLDRASLASLRTELASRGSLRQTYWICALAVNQHSGICAGFGPAPEGDSPQFADFDKKRRDSVSGDVHPLCPCPTPKHFNDSRAMCEMNKFDAMMRYCSRHVTGGFRQVIVVDAKCEVLSRAWVVAELVEARHLRIPQRLKVLSKEAVETFRSLGAIDVRHCSASRPEDKRDILAKISDIDQFNHDINKLIFGRVSTTTQSAEPGRRAEEHLSTRAASGMVAAPSTPPQESLGVSVAAASARLRVDDGAAESRAKTDKRIMRKAAAVAAAAEDWEEERIMRKAAAVAAAPEDQGEPKALAEPDDMVVPERAMARERKASSKPAPSRRAKAAVAEEPVAEAGLARMAAPCIPLGEPGSPKMAMSSAQLAPVRLPPRLASAQAVAVEESSPVAKGRVLLRLDSPRWHEERHEETPALGLLEQLGLDLDSEP